MPSVIVSACLLGVRCRYDGGTCRDRALMDRLMREGCCVVPVCPEQLGGLPTPRAPAEITRGDGVSVLEGEARLVNVDGTDVTEQYVRGARAVLALAEPLGCGSAWLKEKSPACGVTVIKRGDQTCSGMGVTAALLRSSGIEVLGADPTTVGPR